MAGQRATGDRGPASLSPGPSVCCRQPLWVLSHAVCPPLPGWEVDPHTLTPPGLPSALPPSRSVDAPSPPARSQHGLSWHHFHSLAFPLPVSESLGGESVTLSPAAWNQCHPAPVTRCCSVLPLPAAATQVCARETRCGGTLRSGHSAICSKGRGDTGIW